MKTCNARTLVLLITVLVGTSSLPANEPGRTTEFCAADWPLRHAKCCPVPLTEVKAGGYLGKRIDRNPASILLALKSPIPKGFEAAVTGSKPPSYRLAADSDLYKWLEGACYTFAKSKDPEIKKEIDRIAGLIVKCQDDDGYINSQPQKERWDPKVKHDLYIAGHFFEAAVAHYRATGDKYLLNAACRWADYLISEYKKGNPYYTTTALKEHSEYELGLLRLYRATGNRKYLDFSITLTKELCKVGPKVADIKAGGGLHAVRVGYLLTGMADLYLETGSDEMLRYLPGLWDELVNTRMYVTGGIGSQGEGISKEPYDLPHTREHPERTMGETCASVAMIMFSWRMHGITGESRYFDVIENTLYNHYLGAIALNGKGTFYYNPMSMVGDQSKHSDHGHRPVSSRCMLPKINRTACCPSNMWRFFAALSEYLFSYDKEGLFVNLYTSSTVNHTLADGRQIALSVETEYPHQGDIKVRFDGKSPTPFKLRLRIPAWCKSATAQWPGQKENSVKVGNYLVIDRTWKKGDTVQLQFDMPVRMILPNPKVKANAG
ncbi:MAG: glycoside hydrolase family 127 protein, partial [Candidatus Hydrogenedentes bacterium]|nr:glycoside hydrolase family 127 protein [Candidatus Hydrogenedentota bacterium]